jgi:adenylate cyclase
VTTTAGTRTLAVIPLQNIGADKDLDFLRMALADEIATSLSYAQSLSIRPFSTTAKYDSPGVDAQQAGQAMHVNDVVTGHFLKEGSQLQITLEAVDVENNRTIWRDTMNETAADLIAMRNEITAKVRQGLIPALGAGVNSAEGATRPENQEAYDLYLRSISLPHDPQPNKEAIAMLERAVGLDPNYAPAWCYLGVRYHYDSAYSNGGVEMRQRSDSALARAISLDPNYVMPTAWLITDRVEQGELARAYQDAKRLVDRHPENAQARFALAYVLRYGGAMDESATECNAALSLDPGNFMWRSCAFTFDQLGNYDRAANFLQIDAGSGWSNSNLIRHYVREGKLQQAAAVGEKLEKTPSYTLMANCLNKPSPADMAPLVQTSMAVRFADPDPEPRYVVAADMLFCGQREAAVKLLRSAIAGHYCAYIGLQNDSLWTKLRGTPEFAEIVSAAKRCRDDFLSQRSQPAH